MSEELIIPEGKELPLLAIEKHMLEMPQLEIPVEHIFSGGVYLRQVTIPKGAIVMGKRHRGETCNMLLKGTLEVYTDENSPPMIITAPMIFTSKAYAKKFAHAIEESVFINILPTTSKDPEEIERQFIIPEAEYQNLLAEKERAKCLSSQLQ